MIDDSTTPEEAVHLAIEREKSSRQFYLQAAKIARYPGTKQMFEFLAEEELRHYQLLEAELNKDYFKEM